MFNYEEGLVPFEITVNCRVFQSVLNLKLSEDSEKDLNIERNKVCVLKLTAEKNIYLDLFKITSNNENAVKVLSYYHPKKEGSTEDDLMAICVQFQTFNVGKASVSLIEKSTLKIVRIDINVVNLNDENLTYLQILDNFEIGKIEYVYTEASVFDENLTYYSRNVDGSYMAISINEVDEEHISNYFVRDKDGFVVYIQSGASFEAALKTSTNATIELSYKVVDVNNEGGTIYKNLVDKRIEYDADSKTLTFATYSNNEVSNIENENTFEQISIDIKYYAIDEGKIEEKHKIITIKVATYKKLSGFGENLNNKNFEIYDNTYLSIFNQSNNVGIKSFVPTIIKTTNSGLKYKLEYDLRLSDINGYDTVNIEDALSKGWIIEEIKSGEELLGLTVKPQTDNENRKLKKLIVHFSVEEYDIVYHAWFNVECITPTLFTSLSLNVNKINIENFETSNYSSSEIKITEFSPLDVFDKNLTYIVYSQQNSTINCLAVFDENADSMIQRYNNNSPIIFEKNHGVVYAKYDKDGSILSDINYYIKVLPSYLVNKEYGKDDFSEYGGYEGYIKNILDYASLMNSIEINFVDGTEDNPYQIKNQNDLEKMFASGKTNSYFALMNDIKLSGDWSGENDLEYNLISNPYSKVTEVTQDNFKNYYTKTLNYVKPLFYDETATYYTYGNNVYTQVIGNVDNSHFSEYYILQ